MKSILKRGENMGFNHVAAALSVAARKVAEKNVNEACFMAFHQPVVSNSMKEKLRKNK